MGYLSTLGKLTKNTILKSEGHKLSEEFEVAAGQTTYVGLPVKLTNDGKVTIWATADGEHLLIGYCLSGQAAGELVTVSLRGYTVIFALSNAAVNAGPVTHSSYDTTTVVNENTGYNKVANTATAAEVIGWSLDDAVGANELIRVLIKN